MRRKIVPRLASSPPLSCTAAAARPIPAQPMSAARLARTSVGRDIGGQAPGRRERRPSESTRRREACQGGVFAAVWVSTSKKAGGRGLPDFTVRAIERGDREQWAPLWRAYLDFYKTAETPDVTNATWSRLFDALEPVHGLVAAREEKLIGFAHCLFQRSTWLVNARCYLQDLYVSAA